MGVNKLYTKIALAVLAFFYLAFAEAQVDARPDLVQTRVNQPVTFDVLANDIGTSLTIESIGSVSNGSLRLNPDDTITYTPNPDSTEGDSFNYTATDGTDSDSANVRITVVANMERPNVTITASDPNAAEGGANLGRFTITRDVAVSTSLTVNFTVGGTATSGSDYRNLGSSVTIPAGQRTATLVVTPISDTVLENDETVQVTLVARSGYTVGSPSRATVTIADNSPTGGSIRITSIIGGSSSTVDATRAQLETTPQANKATVNLECSGGESGSASVAISVIAGNALADINFEIDRTTVNFDSCDGGVNSQASFGITTFANDTENVSFTLALSNPQGTAGFVQPNEIVVSVNNGGVVQANLAVRLDLVQVDVARSVVEKQLIAIGDFFQLIVVAINQSNINVALATLSVNIPDGFKVETSPSECIENQCQVSITHGERLTLVFQLLVEDLQANTDQISASIDNASSIDPDSSNNVVTAQPDLINVSTNGFIPDSNGLIAGFIVTGTTKRVILSGESIGQQGLADPVIDLINIDTNAVLDSNDNWLADPLLADELQNRLGRPLNATTDAGLIALLGPGRYGARLRDASGAVGTGLVSVTSEQGDILNQLINVSTNGFIPDSNGLIAGFIVIGSEKRVIISGESIGITGLANPVVELVDIFTGAVLQSNDNWQDDPVLAAELEQSLGRPLNAATDAGLVLTLAPGPYGARLRDVSGGSGTGLISVTSAIQ